MIPTKTQRRTPEKASTTSTSVGGGIVIVDSSFRPIALDRRAEAILDDVDAHSGGSDGGSGLPPKIVNLLSGRSHRELEATHLRVSAGDHEYSCRTFVLRPRAEGAIQPMLALYLKRDLSMADAMRRVGADYHLTDRELEALIGVAMGLTSKELAARMNISPNTVKAFLRLIMIKMGVTTRAGIVGKLFDQNGHFSDG
ncbi:MAG: helix-turn-helix transcriptional regulator [Bryobacteraceae bacterium]